MSEKLKQLKIEKELKGKWKERTINDLVRDFQSSLSHDIREYNPFTALIPSFSVNIDLESHYETEVLDKIGNKIHRRKFNVDTKVNYQFNPLKNLFHDVLKMVLKSAGTATLTQYDRELYRQQVLDSNFTEIQRSEESLDQFIEQFTAILETLGIKHLGQFVTYSDSESGPIILGYLPLSNGNTELRRRDIFDLSSSEINKMDWNPVYSYAKEIPILIWNDDKTKIQGIFKQTIAELFEAFDKPYHASDKVKIRGPIGFKKNNEELVLKLKLIKSNHLNFQVLNEIFSNAPNFGKSTHSDILNYFKANKSLSRYSDIIPIELSDKIMAFDFTNKVWYQIRKNNDENKLREGLREIERLFTFSDEEKVMVPVWNKEKTKVQGVFAKSLRNLLFESNLPFYVEDKNSYQKSSPIYYEHIKEITLPLKEEHYTSENEDTISELKTIVVKMKNYDTYKQLLTKDSGIVIHGMTVDDLPYFTLDKTFDVGYIPRELIGYPRESLTFDKGQWKVKYSTVNGRSIQQEKQTLYWLESLENHLTSYNFDTKINGNKVSINWDDIPADDKKHIFAFLGVSSKEIKIPMKKRESSLLHQSMIKRLTEKLTEKEGTVIDMQLFKAGSMEFSPLPGYFEANDKVIGSVPNKSFDVEGGGPGSLFKKVANRLSVQDYIYRVEILRGKRLSSNVKFVLNEEKVTARDIVVTADQLRHLNCIYSYTFESDHNDILFEDNFPYGYAHSKVRLSWMKKSKFEGSFKPDGPLQSVDVNVITILGQH